MAEDRDQDTPALQREMLRRPAFDFVDCALLVNIARARSLTRGAEGTSLSTPAASMRIKHLEETLGVRLIERRREGATLTAAGEIFRRHALDIMAEVGRLEAELAEIKRRRSGHLAILASPMLAHEVLPAMVERFLIEHPDISIDIREDQSPAIIEAVRDGNADMGVVSAEQNAEGLETLPFLDERMVVIVPKGHPLATGRPVAFETLRDYDFVALSTAPALHRFLRRFLGEAGYPELKLRASVGNYDALARLVASGVGIGAMPEATAQHLSRLYAIALVPIADIWASRRLVLCVRSTATMPPALDELIGYLRRTASSFAFG